MTKSEFDVLPVNDKYRLVKKAFAWFTCADYLYGSFGIDNEDGAVIKIILGKYLNDELINVDIVSNVFSN